jgi:AcrR family transcriptional regulator
VPVGGNWTTMVRLAKGSHLMALPVYLLPSPQSHRPGIPVAARSGPMVADTFLLQREARGGPAWLTTTAYAILAAIVAVWLGLLVGARPRRPAGRVALARYRGFAMAAARRARLSTDARREQLVALGVEMFSERPFDDVSIDDIAAAAGISKGLLYHYFPSKRDFYVAVVRHSADEMQAITETDPELEPLEALAAGLDRYLEYVATHARGFATVLRAGIGSDPEVAAIVEGVRAAMARRILDDVAAGDPAPAIRIAVRGWVGFAEAASLEWLERGALSREELRELLIRTLTAAVAAASEASAAR